MKAMNAAVNVGTTRKAAMVNSNCGPERTERRDRIRRIMTDLGAPTSGKRDQEIRDIWREAADSGR